MQIWLGQQSSSTLPAKEVLWWKTYSPPVWLLDGKANTTEKGGLETVDLMGVPVEKLFEAVDSRIRQCDVVKIEDSRGYGDNNKSIEVIVVAPWSRMDLDSWRTDDAKWEWEEMWVKRRHINLDDLDIGGKGLIGTWRRVWQRRGLIAWRVRRRCGN